MVQWDGRSVKRAIWLRIMDIWHKLIRSQCLLQLKRLAVVSIAAMLVGCAVPQPRLPPGEVPRAVMPSMEDEQFGQEVLNQLLEKYKLDRSDANIDRVRGVAERLYTAANGGAMPWHVYVLDDPDTFNAAATKGNYLFVWTGLLTYADSDAELSSVMAHEIGHVLAGHTAGTPQEEVGGMLSGVAGTAAEMAARSDPRVAAFAGIARAIVEMGMQAALVNPTKQSQELEADQIGLYLMADAGYDPEAAVDFWQKISKDPKLSSNGLGFLSTHPSTTDRLTRLQNLLPGARLRYEETKRMRSPRRSQRRN